VQAAAWGSALPLDGFWIVMPFMIEGEQARPEPQRNQARYQPAAAAWHFRIRERLSHVSDDQREKRCSSSSGST